MSDIGKRIQQIEKNEKRIESFITTRMWIDTLISLFRSDSGRIPADIGRNLYLGNNVYVTKNYIHAIIVITEYGDETPIAFTSKLLKRVKEFVPNTCVDFIYKTNPYVLDITDAGLKSRATDWENALVRNTDTPKSLERTARLLYSYNVLKTGKTAFKSHDFIIVRATTGSDLRKSCKVIQGYLSSKNIDSFRVKSSLSQFMQYIRLLCNLKEDYIKDIPQVIHTATTIAEILPNTQGSNSKSGTFLGIDLLNNSPYFENFKSSAKGKNIYIIGPSGEGKTFLVINWLLDFFVDKYRIMCTDIKGNEFKAVTLACGGIVLQMHASNDHYINTFKLNPKGIQAGQTADDYFRESMFLSRTFLSIIADLDDSQVQEGNTFLDTFLNDLYTQIGVCGSNTNTWSRSNNLNPYTVFNYYMKYVSTKDYPQITSNMKMYLDPRSPESKLFKYEYNLSDVLTSRFVTFDYGLITSSKKHNNVTLGLQMLFMDYINDEYSRRCKAEGSWVAKVLEESQYVNKHMKHAYAKEISIRRSQNQVTMLLGNSLLGLGNDTDANIILENINMIVVGKVNSITRDEIIRIFDAEKHKDKIIEVLENKIYDNVFVMLNKLRRDSTVAMLQANVPASAVKSKLFKVVDVID